MTPIGIAILSYAHGHAGTYSEVLKQADDVRLVACYDDDEERGQEMAARYNMAYSPYLENVLNRPDVDAVIVTSETSRHAELTVAAAEAGKHILCQKPMALTLDDCDRMTAAVDKAGVVFSMAFQMRHDPVNQMMRDLVRDGTIGKVGVLRRRHAIGVLFNESFVQGKTHWHIDPEKNMGMFMDDAVHAADFMRWMLGDVVSVTAEIENLLTDVAPDDTGVAIYRFTNGAMGILFNSSVTLAGENTTEIYGDQGVIIQNYGDAPSLGMPASLRTAALKVYTKDGGWQAYDLPVPNSQGDRIANVPRPFIDCLKNGTPLPATAGDGRKSVEMILGAYRSAREGRRVHFPL